MSSRLASGVRIVVDFSACFLVDVYSALELDMSEDDITGFMAGLGYDAKSSISLESFQSGMRQIMRFTMSDKSVSSALVAICKDRCAAEMIFAINKMISTLQSIWCICRRRGSKGAISCRICISQAKPRHLRSPRGHHPQNRIAR
jgi:hypothetical protein